ncbi:MAG TPA: hypothetical protein VI136_01630 [Verrucomicrobiae bacterium]
MATLIPALSRVFSGSALFSLVVFLAANSRAATFAVTTTANSGAGSLRQAILDAGTTPGSDLIVFDLPGSGPFTIAPLTALPAIQESLTIDGTTQPGYVGLPLIELRGSSAGANADGLYLLSTGCVIKGLCINRFTRNGIRVENFGGNVIQGCHVGTDVWGTNALGNSQSGIFLQSAANVVGGTNAADRNVVSGGSAAGIYLSGSTARSNWIAGNYIGLDATGARRLGNLQEGIRVFGAVANTIGGTMPGARNVISANGYEGIGIEQASALSNRIEGNFIGTDATGMSSRSNGAHGISISGGSWNVIGGDSPESRNVISGNATNGVYVVPLANAGGTNNTILGNYIGTDVTGTNRLANGAGHGVQLAASRNLVGPGNVISGNGLSGVAITGANSISNRILGNLIGTDRLGQVALSNGWSGVTLVGASSNVVGGADAAGRNVISGNAQHGIFVQSASARDNVIQGNFIGTDVTGRLGVGNEFSGVCLEGSGNVVGGSTSEARNVISGNLGYGVWLLGSGAFSNLVAGNFIGVDVTGAGRLGNEYSGVALENAPRNLIGGVEAGAGNVISANLNNGVLLQSAGAAFNTVQGNCIGTDISGTLGRGNSLQGIFAAAAPSNTVGGAVTGARNLISANGLSGVRLRYPGVNAWVIQGNYIGTQADGVGNLGNGQHAIELYADSAARDHLIGGAAPGEGNRIAYTISSAYDGVRIRAGCTNNLVVGNAIWANGGSATAGLGIDLDADGVSANDNCDGDAGANQLQNFPVLTNVWTSPTATVIRGTLNSTPNKNYWLHFYANSTNEPSGYGEGENYLGQLQVRTAANCTTNFTARLAVGAAAGSFITATATDEANNTSEFSQGIAAQSQPVLTCDQAGGGTLLTLAWPAAAKDFALQQATNLDSPIFWFPVTNPPVLSGGSHTVSLGTTNGSRFYRLSLQ